MTRAEDINKALDEFEKFILDGEVDAALDKMGEVTDLYEVNESRDAERVRSGIARKAVATPENPTTDADGSLRKDVVDSLGPYDRHLGAGAASSAVRAAVSSSLLSMVLDPGSFTDKEVSDRIDELKLQVSETEETLDSVEKEATDTRESSEYDVPPSLTVRSVSLERGGLGVGDSTLLSATVRNVGESAAEGVTAEIDSDSGVGLSKSKFDIGRLESDEVYSLESDVTVNGGGSHTVFVEVSSDNAGDGVNSLTVAAEAEEGGLSSDNPFGDSSNNPVDRETVIGRIVEWNLDENNEIDGTEYTQGEIINYIVEWNLA